jgi:hypothetical protein
LIYKYLITIILFLSFVTSNALQFKNEFNQITIKKLQKLLLLLLLLLFSISYFHHIDFNFSELRILAAELAESKQKAIRLQGEKDVLIDERNSAVSDAKIAKHVIFSFFFLFDFVNIV